MARTHLYGAVVDHSAADHVSSGIVRTRQVTKHPGVLLKEYNFAIILNCNLYRGGCREGVQTNAVLPMLYKV